MCVLTSRIHQLTNLAASHMAIQWGNYKTNMQASQLVRSYNYSVYIKWYGLFTSNLHRFDLIDKINTAK